MFSEKPKYASLERLRWARERNNGLIKEVEQFSVQMLSLTEVRKQKNAILRKYPGAKVEAEFFQNAVKYYLEYPPEPEYVIILSRPMFAEERRMLEADD